AVMHRLPWVQVAHTAINAQEFMRGLGVSGSIDIALVDLSMPGTDGFAVLRRLKENRPEIRPLVFSFSVDLVWVRNALEQGACGYLVKDALAETLGPALREVMDSGYHISDLMRASMTSTEQVKEIRIDWSSVPQRERQFVEHLLASGDPTYPQIADRMGVSKNTVDGYFRWFNQHFGISSRTELVRLALKYPPGDEMKGLLPT
ncbi:MAG: response regulator transcription factor, partial [Flavobacteriales bacterium]